MDMKHEFESNRKFKIQIFFTGVLCFDVTL